MRRRTVLAWGLSLPLAAVAGGCQARPEPRGVDGLLGQALDSVSVQFAGVSTDGAWQVQIYHCAFPGEGVAWNWVHLLTPDGFYAGVDNHLPDEAGRDVLSMPERDDALYRHAGPPRISISRQGPLDAVMAGAASASGRLRRTGGAGGPDLIGVDLEARFVPALSMPGLLPGRTETFGTTEVDLTIDGRAIRFQGPGKLHEQPQSSPRFAIPFVYATLWGRSRAFTAIFSNEGNGGVLAEAGRRVAIVRFDVAPPGPERLFRLHLDDGRRLEGVARTRIDYDVPAFNTTYAHQWPALDLDGEPLFGDVGDFRSAELDYPIG